MFSEQEANGTVPFAVHPSAVNSNGTEDPSEKEPSVDTVPVLADAVEEVFARRNWSLRRAAEQTGITIGILYALRRGRPARTPNIRRWAQAIGEPEEKWLRLAIGDANAMPSRVLDSPSAPSEPIATAYAHLSPIGKGLVNDLITSLQMRGL